MKARGQLHARGLHLGGDRHPVIEAPEQADVRGKTGGHERRRKGLNRQPELRPGGERVGGEGVGDVLIPGQIAKHRPRPHDQVDGRQSEFPFGRGLGRGSRGGAMLGPGGLRSSLPGRSALLGGGLLLAAAPLACGLFFRLGRFGRFGLAVRGACRRLVLLVVLLLFRLGARRQRQGEDGDERRHPAPTPPPHAWPPGSKGSAGAILKDTASTGLIWEARQEYRFPAPE